MKEAIVLKPFEVFPERATPQNKQQQIFKPILMPSDMEELRKNFAELKEGQQDLMKQVSGVAGKINDVEDRVNDVRTALQGNEDLGNSGIVKRVKKLEERADNYDKIYYKIIGGMMIIGFVWTLLVTVLLKFWDKIF
jgi:tetrahydromethanopterin S-methyltransferase subunit B